MADKEIGDLTSGGALVDGDLAHVVRGPNSRKVALSTTAGAIHSAAAKATPHDNDEIGLVDSQASNVLKNFTWANLKAAAKAYFDTLYASLAGAVFTGAIQTTTINAGHASDTPITRSAAGIVAVAGIPLYPSVPVQDKNTAYTLVAGDAQTCIRHPSTDNNARAYTIPANATVPFPVGTFVMFRNRINTITIGITSDTLRWAPSDATGTRTLAGGGIATIYKEDATTWVISGVGLT